MKQGIDMSDCGGNYANSAVTGANYDRFCFAHWSHFEKDTPHPRLKKKPYPRNTYKTHPSGQTAQW